MLGKFHTLARSSGFSPKLATYELCELDEYRRARRQREMSISDEDLMDQLKDYERDVSGCEMLVYIVSTTRDTPSLVTVTSRPWRQLHGDS